MPHHFSVPRAGCAQMPIAAADSGDRAAQALRTGSSPTALARALIRPCCDPERDPPAAAREIERLWRRHGGDWRDLVSTTILLAGVAQLAWCCARCQSAQATPPFAVAFAASPRCVRILLPDDSRHFGAVITWLRHFEVLLPVGAPTCHLVLPARAGCAATPSAGRWVWGMMAASAPARSPACRQGIA